MKSFVSAILVIGDSKDFLASALSSIANQPIDELIVVDTSVAPDRDSVGATKYISAPAADYSKAIALAAAEVDESSTWMWLLHDDCAPLPGALKQLLAVAERSPSAAVIGAKQVDYQNHRVIKQMGLTLTTRGNLFTLVTGELDQSQHDDASDVLAVGTGGTLVRRDLYVQLDGFDERMPELAADFDFSMRARLAGYRVVVAPQAKVAHALRSLTGPKTALRKAEIQLQLSYLPLGFALAYWFGLPLITFVRLVWRLFNKRPDRLWGEFVAGLWGWFTLFARLRSRRSVSRSGRAAIRALYATRQQVRDDRRRDLEADEIEARLEAHAQLADRDGEVSTNTAQLLLNSSAQSKGLIAAGGLWFVFVLLALSYSFWPSGEAVAGGGALPLSQSWLELFARAGASWHPIANGFFAPADPFNWALTAIGGLTFWSPSLALAILVFAAKAISFITAFKAVSVFTRRSWIRNLASASYALWPALTLAQSELRIGALVAIALAPFIVFSIARVALLGTEISVRTKAQTWTWVALSGLTIAAVASAAPNTIGLILIVLIVVLLLRPRRFGYLIWTGLPLAAIFAPFVFYLVVGLAHPLAVFATPGVPLATDVSSFASYLVGLPATGFGIWFSGFFGAGLVVLALLGVLSRASGRVVGLLGFGVLALLAAWMFANIQFVATGVGPAAKPFVNGDPTALLGIWGLALSLALATWLDATLPRSTLKLFGALTVLGAILPTAALGILTPTLAHWSGARVMPALIDAQARAGSDARVLVLSATDGGYSAQWISANGVQLEDLSVAYRYALASIESNSTEYKKVAELAADLISANQSSAQQLLTETKIQYVLVTDPTSVAATAISASLDQVASLEAAGLTEYGKVWRVTSATMNTKAITQTDLWSITKLIQVAVLFGFVLLAIPTSGRKRIAVESEIFMDAGESND
ncbi:MAG: hypothetical protein RLZZ164_453 [Actinomycetota bacterium]|jgi:GT2 family glycosyltransferase